jgi:predicted transcriptional regulator
MNRITSRIAYKNIIEEGKSDSQQGYIVRLLKHEFPLSRREIAKATNIEISAVSGRVNELINMGIVEETTMRKCMFSKRLVKPVQLVEGL